MRKTYQIFLLFTAALLTLFFFGCRKIDIAPEKNNVPDKISAYLESQKLTTANSVNKNANIDLLKENLDFSGTTTEQLDSRLNILIVPIKDAVIKRKNLDPNSTLILFLLTDKHGEINSASIVYFQPSDGKKHASLPQNTLSNMFSGKAVPLDGVYKMLAITGRWLSQIQIKDGRLYSSGIVQKKDTGSNATQRTNTTCTDWYLVTTYYWSDGTTSQTWEYLGTTCAGCDDPDYQSRCPDGGGGGGSTGPDEIESAEDDISVTTSEAAPNPNSGPSGGDGPLIPITWHAWVAWSYNLTQQHFDYIRPGTPYPIPVSQGFTDQNGNPAILAVALGPWTVAQIPLTFKAVLVQYTLVSIHNYIYTTGTITRTFDDGMSKVIGPL